MKYFRHPKYSNVIISEDGSIIKKNNIEIPIRISYPKKNTPLLTVTLYGTTYISFPKLVNEAVNGLPPKGKRHVTECIDGNYKNTHPSNLRWVTATKRRLDPAKQYTIHTKRSKLTSQQSIYCYNKHTKENISYEKLAIQFDTSAMTIARAVKRVKRYYNQLGNI